MYGYVVITPARNEARNIERTVDSMLGQTYAPRRWIVVDDGSSDATSAIVERRTKDVPWVDLVVRSDRGHRSAGTGVMEAFHEGRARVQETDWEFIVKLDADLEFASDYFERCLGQFASDPKLGIAGGKVYDVDANRVVHDPHPAFHVRGATKIYRRACWEDIGGLLVGPGWDTLDEVKANQLGWSTRTLVDVPIYQLRPTGSAAGSWPNWVKNGVAAYRSGYHPAFVAVRAARRLLQPPSVVAPAGLLWGYARSWLSRSGRVDDPDLVRYVRQQQWNRLTGRESMWR